MSGLALEVDGLVLSAPGAPAILDLPRLACPAGARIAVTGPSGSGKTSLVHVLAGLLRPDRGRIRWGGQELGPLSETARDAWRRRHVGLVFQDFHLLPELDLLGNVLLPARFAAFRVPAATRERALGLIAQVGLADPGRRAGLLSRGEQQRTALARALLHRPAVILADEPTASLDAEAGRAVADLLLETAAESGATLVVATHDPDFASRLGTTWPLRAGAAAPIRQAA